jgi:hypothetical protein
MFLTFASNPTGDFAPFKLDAALEHKIQTTDEVKLRRAITNLCQKKIPEAAKKLEPLLASNARPSPTPTSRLHKAIRTTVPHRTFANMAARKSVSCEQREREKHEQWEEKDKRKHDAGEEIRRCNECEQEIDDNDWEARCCAIGMNARAE